MSDKTSDYFTKRDLGSDMTQAEWDIINRIQDIAANAGSIAVAAAEAKRDEWECMFRESQKHVEKLEADRANLIRAMNDILSAKKEFCGDDTGEQVDSIARKSLKGMERR